MSWEENLWSELNEMEPTRQIIATGELIARINQHVLPALADRRRDVVCELLATPEWDATKLAESIGSRRGTVVRLAQEGRSRHRELL
jgi:hypothetical protein